MKLYISTEDNKIFASDHLLIKSYNEYIHPNCDTITVNPISKLEIGQKIDNILLIPNTHIINLWHLMHHLFITYKYLKINNFKIMPIYFVFFSKFYIRQGDILSSLYDDLIFTGFGFKKEDFINIHNIFKEQKCIEVTNLHVVNTLINFINEPEFESFKLFILNNFNLKYEISNKKIITFILRKDSRKILNIEEVKQKLKYDINYIYLEDYSIKEQLQIISNTDILLGIHGAGLTWAVFMKNNSLLIEMYPGNSNTDNYIRWCKIANIKYKRVVVSIKEGNIDNFRNCNVELRNLEINNINILTTRHVHL